MNGFKNLGILGGGYSGGGINMLNDYLQATYPGANRIGRRFLNRRIDRHRWRTQFYHEAPQGIAYRRPDGP